MEELNCSFFNPNWDSSIDQNDPFESALSSMVSSPTASSATGYNVNNGGENIVLRELIGRLGGICNSGEISPFGNNTTTNTSCYNTPLNSPPKLNLSAMENQRNSQIHGSPFPSFPFSTDPGFAERAARFSCFAQMGLGEIGDKLESGKISRVSINHSMEVPGSQEKTEIADSREMSSISEQIPGGEIGLNIPNDSNSRKRRSVSKGKRKETTPASAPAKDANVGSESNESSAKRSKSDDGSKNEKEKEESNGNAKSKDNSKPEEPVRDYIHVRARRGQATDAHSLAERVRREKIGERMKFLQDLVPGCNKVTGKAVMLDEIINYVQSLQRQVEFLSMKLATVNPRMCINMEALASKDMFQSRGSLPPNMYPSDCYPYQSQPNLHTAIPNGTEALNHFNAALGRNQLPPMNNFNETASQVSTFWENDLQNVVQMGYGQSQSQDVHDAQMKVEP